MRIALLAAALCLVAAGCVTTASEGEAMRADIARLRADLKTEKEAAQEERDRIRTEQAAKLKEMQDALDALNRSARKSGADLSVDLEKAQNDLAQIRGTLEVMQHRLDAIEQANLDRDKKLEAAAQWQQAKQKEQEKAEHPSDKQGVYTLAKKKLDEGNTARARELLTDFLARFHQDELAPNAQYWLGETYYAEKRFNEAIVEFQKVLKEWKTSEKLPDALLKIGMSFQALDSCEKALLFFDDVIATHRTSSAAKVAREKAAECRKAGRKAP